MKVVLSLFDGAKKSSLSTAREARRRARGMRIRYIVGAVYFSLASVYLFNAVSHGQWPIAIVCVLSVSAVLAEGFFARERMKHMEKRRRRQQEAEQPLLRYTDVHRLDLQDPNTSSSKVRVS